MNIQHFQSEVKRWAIACFGVEIAIDQNERNHRFLEEALELVQAAGCTKEECLQLVDYVYNRPKGEIHQEIGGALITLAALCNAHNMSMEEEGSMGLFQNWHKIEKIREKRNKKPKFSPLPQ